MINRCQVERQIPAARQGKWPPVNSPRGSHGRQAVWAKTLTTLHQLTMTPSKPLATKAVRSSSPAKSDLKMPAPMAGGMAAAERETPATSAFSRLLQILDLFTLDKHTIRVEEVMDRFGMVQSTAYRYLKELCDAGLLAQQGKGVYSLGRRIVELERLLQLSDPLLLAGRQVMDGLQKLADNRTFLLCAYYKDAALCVHKVGPDEIAYQGALMKILRGRGTVLSLFSGAGSQVILANLPPHQIKSKYLTSAAQIADAGLGAEWKDFRNQLSVIRKKGFAETIGKMNPGMHSLAVPVMRQDGKVAGSLLMIGPAQPDAMQQAVELVPTLKATADQIALAVQALDRDD